MAAPPAAARTDWAGVVHDVVRAPRIASLVPSLTELLFALDLGEHVVARTGFCVHPKPAVRRVPKIGGTKDPDLARLAELAPTHLVVNVDENRRDVVDAARRFVPNVVVTHPLAPEENPRLYRLFGAIFARAAPAAALTRQFAAALARLDAFAARLPRERVLYLIWRNPWMTVRRDTYVSATLARAGYDTLPTEAPVRYPAIAEEADVWRTAQRLLLSTEPYAFRARDAQALAARRARPALLIDGEWTSWYGPRAIAGLDALARFRADVAAREG